MVGEEGHGPRESVGGPAQVAAGTERRLRIPAGEDQGQLGRPCRPARTQPEKCQDNSHSGQERQAPPEEGPKDSPSRCPPDHQGNHERNNEEVGHVEADGKDEQQARTHGVAVPGERGSKTIRNHGDVEEQRWSIDLDR